MNPIRTYDYLTVSRQRVFDAVRPLGPAAYEREFPVGPGTLGRILTHIMISEWYYVERLLERDVPPYEEWPIHDETPPPFATLEATWTTQAVDTRAALALPRNWDEQFEYRVTDETGQAMIVTTSASDLVTQLVLHEMHHRAQALNVLRQLGVTIDDLDFNASFPRRPASD